MSTAAAPVSECSAALQAVAAITCSTPARPPRTTRRRRSAARGDQFLVQRQSRPENGYRRPEPRSPPPRRPISATDPARRRRRSEMTPLKVVESSVASSARNCCGSLELQMTIMPGPAAMRASCTNPVTIKTGRGSFNCDQPNCPRSRRPPPPKSHPDPYHPAVGAPQIPVPRQRPERKELRVAMITQIKHPRKARCRVARLVPEPFVGLCGF